MARIVIAEDHVHIRHVLVMWMKRHGHEVHEAPNGAVALKLLTETPADVLLTDVNMPEMDGLELTGKAFTACPTLRAVFVVTSRCDQRDILERLCDPRIRVLPKPFSPSRLVELVAELMAESAAMAPSSPPAGGVA